MRIPTGVAIALVICGTWLIRGALNDAAAIVMAPKGYLNEIAIALLFSGMLGTVMVLVGAVGSLRQQEPPK